MMKSSNLSSANCSALLVGMLMIVSAVWAQTAPGARYPITESTVVSFLQSNGIFIAPSQVHLPMPLSAKSSLPELEVTAAQQVNHHQLQIGFRCVQAGECLPFNATLEVMNSDNVSAELRAVIASHSNISELADNSIAGSLHAQVPALQAKRVASKLARAGTRVCLIIRDGHMEIHLPVLMLDTAAAGKQVRVSSLDRKKVFSATVVDSQTVSGVPQ